MGGRGVRREGGRTGTVATKVVKRVIVVRDVIVSAVRPVRRAVPEVSADVGYRPVGGILAGAVGVPLAVAVGVGGVGNTRKVGSVAEGRWGPTSKKGGGE